MYENISRLLGSSSRCSLLLSLPIPWIFVLILLAIFRPHSYLQHFLLDPHDLFPIFPIVVSLYLSYYFLHLLRLPLPLRLAHLALAAEQLLVRFAVTSAETVPQRRELAIVVIEV